MRVIRVEESTKSVQAREDFRLGTVDILPARNLLRSSNGDVSLEPKVMDVLCVLFDKAGQTLSREDILSSVWHQRYGGDESLTRAISILRKRFGELAPGTPIIETIPKRGYRLVQIPDAPIPDVEPSSTAPDAGVIVISVRRGTLAFAASLALVATHVGILHGETLGHGMESLVAALSPDETPRSVASPVREATVLPSPSRPETFPPGTCDTEGLPFTPAFRPVWQTSL